MTTTAALDTLADPIPPTDVVRHRLALVATEANLLQRLLRLVLQRDREAQRLDQLRQEGGPRCATA
jgi:hypothetical protein